MDAGMAIKPVVSVVNTHAQPAVASAPPIATVLPIAKAVGPAVHSEPTRNEPRPQAHTAGNTTHDAIIDPETREIVYRLLDARTRQVIHQVPDQARLRMQAYARAQAAQALASGKNPAEAAQETTHTVDALT